MNSQNTQITELENVNKANFEKKFCLHLINHCKIFSFKGILGKILQGSDSILMQPINVLTSCYIITVVSLSLLLELIGNLLQKIMLHIIITKKTITLCRVIAYMHICHHNIQNTYLLYQRLLLG